MASISQDRPGEREVRVPVGGAVLEGTLALPPDAFGVVLFAHGSGSSRHSPRNRFVASVLRDAGLATLLVDLLTPEEGAIDARTAQHRFDIGLLARRLVGATDWLGLLLPEMSVGYFGASTGAGAALVAAARRPEAVGAIVSRGGRPDLAGPDLARVHAPTLLIVGGADAPVIHLNESALRDLAPAVKQLVIVPGATHLFEEPGTLAEVAQLAADWFARHLRPVSATAGP
jgi:pimeloyl-ACP methyl ester carboxylesterase